MTIDGEEKIYWDTIRKIDAMIKWYYMHNNMEYDYFDSFFYFVDFKICPYSKDQQIDLEKELGIGSFYHYYSYLDFNAYFPLNSNNKNKCSKTQKRQIIFFILRICYHLIKGLERFRPREIFDLTDDLLKNEVNLFITFLASNIHCIYPPKYEQKIKNMDVALSLYCDIKGNNAYYDEFKFSEFSKWFVSNSHSIDLETTFNGDKRPQDDDDDDMAYLWDLALVLEEDENTIFSVLQMGYNAVHFTESQRLLALHEQVFVMFIKSESTRQRVKSMDVLLSLYYESVGNNSYYDTNKIGKIWGVFLFDFLLNGLDLESVFGTDCSSTESLQYLNDLAVDLQEDEVDIFSVLQIGYNSGQFIAEDVNLEQDDTRYLEDPPRDKYGYDKEKILLLHRVYNSVDFTESEESDINLEVDEEQKYGENDLNWYNILNIIHHHFDPKWSLILEDILVNKEDKNFN